MGRREMQAVVRTRPHAADWNDECRTLMARYQAGDRQAFEGLYRRFAPVLSESLGTLRPDLRRDPALVDDVFLAIHAARRSYDPRRPFEPWAMAIARHVAASRRGQQGRLKV